MTFETRHSNLWTPPAKFIVLQLTTWPAPMQIHKQGQTDVNSQQNSEDGDAVQTWNFRVLQPRVAAAVLRRFC
jgi:hypothetical protein